MKGTIYSWPPLIGDLCYKRYILALEKWGKLEIVRENSKRPTQQFKALHTYTAYIDWVVETKRAQWPFLYEIVQKI